MKRDELREIGVNKWHTFICIFERYGRKEIINGKKIQHVCVTLVVNNSSGELVTDHVWVDINSRLLNTVSPKEGDVLKLKAMVQSYHGNHTGLKRGSIMKVWRDENECTSL